jgi:hypothetical protein
MSWLRRLLGAERERPAAEPMPEPAPANPARVNIASHGRRIVSVPELDFVGERATSPNGRFTLLWRDRCWMDDQVVEGRYVLIDGDAVAVDARMERPQDGKVADDGTFILNDWGASDELSGTFHAFRAVGTEIVSRRYSANLLNNGLSRDGRLAVCQTCNAPGSPDSSILTVFDLERGAEVASWVPESGWARGYEFPGGQRIRMLRGDRPPLDYSHGGFPRPAALAPRRGGPGNALRHSHGACRRRGGDRADARGPASGRAAGAGRRRRALRGGRAAAARRNRGERRQLRRGARGLRAGACRQSEGGGGEAGGGVEEGDESGERVTHPITQMSVRHEK